MRADQEFQDWARDFEATGQCGTADAHYQAGFTFSKAASQAKTDFAKAWNSYIVGPYHVPPVSEPQL